MILTASNLDNVNDILLYHQPYQWPHPKEIHALARAYVIKSSFERPNHYSSRLDVFSDSIKVKEGFHGYVWNAKLEELLGDYPWIKLGSDIVLQQAAAFLYLMNKDMIEPWKSMGITLFKQHIKYGNEYIHRLSGKIWYALDDTIQARDHTIWKGEFSVPFGDAFIQGLNQGRQMVVDDRLADLERRMETRMIDLERRMVTANLGTASEESITTGETTTTGEETGATATSASNKKKEDGPTSSEVDRDGVSYGKENSIVPL